MLKFDSWPPAVTALFLQAAAFASVALINHLFSLNLPAFVFAGAIGLTAAGLSYLFKLAGWWLPIQCLFAPALLAALTLNIQPEYFLLLFFILWLVYWNTAKTQVPLYLSSKKARRALEALLPPFKPEARFDFIDIGSGLGGVLMHLAKARPDGNYYGVESAPLPFLLSWLRIKASGRPRCQVRWGDFWQGHLGEYDVVFAFLSPAPMEKLWLKAKAEMKPGSVFISSTFNIPGQSPAQTIHIDDLHHSSLLIWRM